jgi:hypothetical protein
MNRTCETCKYWDFLEVLSECSTIIFYGKCKNNSFGQFLASQGDIYYPAKFGCIHWEEEMTNYKGVKI